MGGVDVNLQGCIALIDVVPDLISYDPRVDVQLGYEARVDQLKLERRLSTSVS